MRLPGEMGLLVGGEEGSRCRLHIFSPLKDALLSLHSRFCLNKPATTGAQTLYAGLDCLPNPWVWLSIWENSPSKRLGRGGVFQKLTLEIDGTNHQRANQTASSLS